MIKNDLFCIPGGRIPTDQIEKIRNEILEFSKKNNINNAFARHKPHLLLPSIYELALNTEILSNVENFVGEKCFAWYSVLFNKAKKTKAYIPWHYDDYFWNLKGNGCTVWVAVNDVNLDMGPMEFAHDYNIKDLRHNVNNDENNILLRGNIANYQPSDDVQIYQAPLESGEYSIHSNKVMHRSGINQSDDDRLAFAIRFISTNSVPTSFALIKRGVVTNYQVNNYFYKEKRPDKIYNLFKNFQHTYSLMCSSFFTFFGDQNRNLKEKILDMIKFIFSKKFMELIFYNKKKIFK